MHTHARGVSSRLGILCCLTTHSAAAKSLETFVNCLEAGKHPHKISQTTLPVVKNFPFLEDVL